MNKNAMHNAVDTKSSPLIPISDDDTIDFMIRDLLSEKLGMDIQFIRSDSRIDDDLNIDSLDFADIIMEIGKKFRIKITDEESEKFKTVESIIRFVKLKI